MPSLVPLLRSVRDALVADDRVPSVGKDNVHGVHATADGATFKVDVGDTQVDVSLAPHAVSGTLHFKVGGVALGIRADADAVEVVRALTHKGWLVSRLAEVTS